MNKTFGITRCGEILEEKIKDDNRLARKIRNFYCQSCVIINELKSKIIDPSVREIAMLAYVNYRQRQVDSDLKLDVYEVEFATDVKKRLKYVIRHHAKKS